MRLEDRMICGCGLGFEIRPARRRANQLKRTSDQRNQPVTSKIQPVTSRIQPVTSRNQPVTRNQPKNLRSPFLVIPRSYWLRQEHPGIYQELAYSNQELRPEVPAHEYFFNPLQINTYIMTMLAPTLSCPKKIRKHVI